MTGNTVKFTTTGRMWLRIKNRATKRKIIFSAITSFLDNDLITSAAAITYFGVLVLFPTLLLALNAAQSYFGDSIHREILSRLPVFIPGSAVFVRRNLEAITQVSTGMLLAAFTVVLWAGSWIFTVIERAMCRMWGTQPRSFLHGRLLTIGMIAVIGIVLMSSAIVTSGFVTVQALTADLPVKQVPWIVATLGTLLWQTILIILSWLLTTSLFILIYRIMPNTRLTVLEVLPGAIIAGVLWEGAKYGFAYLLPYFHYDLLYGSIGAGVALLTWGYVSSLIMLFGAQLTAVLHCRRMFGADMAEDSDPS